MEVQLLSIGVDSTSALYQEVQRLDLRAPFLSDDRKRVSKAYGLPLLYAGEPGHIFVLVGKDGVVKWAKDYAIPGQNPVMYVSPSELDQEIGQHLDGTK
jgi:peroxiredoxin